MRGTLRLACVQIANVHMRAHIDRAAVRLCMESSCSQVVARTHAKQDYHMVVTPPMPPWRKYITQDARAAGSADEGLAQALLHCVRPAQRVEAAATSKRAYA